MNKIGWASRDITLPRSAMIQGQHTISSVGPEGGRELVAATLAILRDLW